MPYIFFLQKEKQGSVVNFLMKGRDLGEQNFPESYFKVLG